MRARSVALAMVAVSVTLAFTACVRSPSQPGPGVRSSPSTVGPAFVAGPLPSAAGTPPADPAALALAREWITAATPPPGVHVLDAPPAAGPRAPATTAACDWLVEATKWWSTDSANVAAASTWLTEHPVHGLAADGTMTGPGESSAIFEHAPQKRNDSLEFEFVPDGDSVTIRVDAVIVPAGAGCASAGAAGAASSSGR